MRLADIKEGIVVRCTNCFCGDCYTADGKKGMVAEVYFKQCECRDPACVEAFHEGSRHAFAWHVVEACDVAGSDVPRGRWSWAADVKGWKLRLVERS